MVDSMTAAMFLKDPKRAVSRSLSPSDTWSELPPTHPPLGTKVTSALQLSQLQRSSLSRWVRSLSLEESRDAAILVRSAFPSLGSKATAATLPAGLRPERRSRSGPPGGWVGCPRGPAEGQAICREASAAPLRPGAGPRRGGAEPGPEEGSGPGLSPEPGGPRPPEESPSPAESGE